MCYSSNKTCYYFNPYNITSVFICDIDKQTVQIQIRPSIMLLIGTICGPFVADLYLYYYGYKRPRVVSISSHDQAGAIEAFNSIVQISRRLTQY